MGKDKKKGGAKPGSILFVILVLVAGLLVAGYFKPDLPVVGPLVAGFFEKAAEGVDKSGVYKVTVKSVELNPEEFVMQKGHKVDIQVRIVQYDSAGKKKASWDSDQYGERIAEIGSDQLTANWADRPFEVNWVSGDYFAVEVWNEKGANQKLCEWQTEPESKTFPLGGKHEFDKFKGQNTRPGGTNLIDFSSERVRDLPEE